MSITKTDFMRGMQCPRMLWLDKHRPEMKVIPPEIRAKLCRGTAFGDAMKGYFGPYTEVREYLPGTSRPDIKAMAEKTKELLETGTEIICEAAFLSEEGYYCAADILKKEGEVYDLYEVKNGAEVTETFIRDAAFQAHLIRRTGLPLRNVFIIYHGEEPCAIEDITEKAADYASMIEQNLPRLNEIKYREEEVLCPTGEQCFFPYGCWYTDYCAMAENGLLEKPRCRWCNPKNKTYVDYHDKEWSVPCHDEQKLYELFILESFQAGLSWEIILNKRENFREAYDGFLIEKVCAYGPEKVEELMGNAGIVRNRRKIESSIANSRIFRQIQREYGSFDAYIWGFTEGKTILECDPAVTESQLSGKIARDLGKRGMRFAGTTIIYSYLQAIGIINAHEEGCFLYQGK